MTEKQFSCVQPTSTTEAKQSIKNTDNNSFKKEEMTMLRVGKPTPDFTLSGYHKGEFKEFTLSDYKGKWVLLCFYPGDFTFV